MKTISSYQDALQINFWTAILWHRLRGMDLTNVKSVYDSEFECDPIAITYYDEIYAKAFNGEYGDIGYNSNTDCFKFTIAKIICIGSIVAFSLENDRQSLTSSYFYKYISEKFSIENIEKETAKIFGIDESLFTAKLAKFSEDILQINAMSLFSYSNNERYFHGLADIWYYFGLTLGASLLFGNSETLCDEDTKPSISQCFYAF